MWYGRQLPPGRLWWMQSIELMFQYLDISDLNFKSQHYTPNIIGRHLCSTSYIPSSYNLYLQSTDYEIKREDDRIHKVFQDPTGHHVIVSMATSKECYYIGRATGRKTTPKLLPKVKGHLIESVAWNKLESSDNGTGPILLGTSTGEWTCSDMSHRHL